MVAFRLCRELEIGRRHFHRSTALEMLLFDAKTLLSSIPRILVTQTTRLFIVGALGPVALAIIARPMALLDHTRTIAGKFAVIVTPIAASFQGSGRESETPDFLIESVYYSAAITLPSHPTTLPRLFRPQIRLDCTDCLTAHADESRELFLRRFTVMESQLPNGVRIP